MTTVCLCGSARFEAQFKEASTALGLMGIVVIGLSSYPSEHAGEKNWYGPDEKEMLDLVHLEKVRMADAVLVIDGTRMSGNVSDAYVGFSTAREILWAKMQDKPVISLTSSKGWGNIYEMLQYRFNEEWFEDHRWLVAHSHATLKINAGVDVVKDMAAQGEHDILHGGLSAMACQIDGAAGTYAQLVLEAAGLDPLSSIPPNVPVFMGVGGNPFPPAAPTGLVEAEPMVTIERRRLVGTIIMAQALSNMLARKPKNSRRDVIDKIDMMIDTIYESFGVSREEVRTALYGDDGDVLDNEVLEAGTRLAS